ncbi:type 1 glutamine amidotransferase domain-containing protein [uncultured Algimonas sp.]|uniref:type 1 glutamine amidotransferase domain-containing protein n=1 Tax=uncultured Algimonas sp. TaxID=1547920 RepID=UPI00261BC3AF|nr:type 1 glutamine amidotransferase domain-containing protein [uncultured Algimonas sp.]
MTNLNEKTILIIAADGFQQEEFFELMDHMRNEGATVHVASMTTEPIKADSQERREYTPELTFSDVKVGEYDALIIPGGLKNPDTLRQQDDAVKIVRDFAESGRTIGAICHGPWLLAEADIVQGLNMTSYPSIKTDMRNAGANWFDSETVTDNGIVTSRKPSDIPAFNKKLVEEIKEGRHERSFKTDMKRAA